jgi:Cu/Ag efflux protein CusF
MSINKYAGILALFLSFTIAQAGEEPADQVKISLFTSQSAQITAVVEAIDHETRVVTLRGPEGNAVIFTASEEARNLAQVKVGDIVSAEVIQSMRIEVFANDGMEPGRGEISALGRTAEGEMPGAVAIDTQIITATVEEINIEANTFKLKGPDGTVNEFVARNPENLKKASVGDLVVITYTEALAISVEAASVEGTLTE